MKKKLITLCATLIAASATMMAQEDDVSRTINMIKKSKEFLYGEATMPNKGDAFEMANDILQQDIETWVVSHSKKKVEKVVATNVRQVIDSIVTPRANMIRVFLYVRKKNLIPIYEGMGLHIVDVEATDNIVIPLQKATTDTLQAPPPTPQDVTEKIDTIQAPLPMPKDTTAVDTTNVDSLSQIEVRDSDIVMTPTEEHVLARIKPLKSFFQIRDVLMPMKEEGLIENYGKYESLTEPEHAYLIIYDPNGRIRAVLGKGAKKRKNLNTGVEETISDYRDCGAIWFTCSATHINDK